MSEEPSLENQRARFPSAKTAGFVAFLIICAEVGYLTAAAKNGHLQEAVAAPLTTPSPQRMHGSSGKGSKGAMRILTPTLTGTPARTTKTTEPSARAGSSKLVYPGTDGRLVYKPYNDRGDTIPDFSLCGYGQGDEEIPIVRVVKTLEPMEGDTDDLPRIQAAIDEVANLPLNADGFRGAILLKKGTYRLSNTLRIAESGIVLRGEGEGDGGTRLHGTTRKAYDLIQVKGRTARTEHPETKQKITDVYVPVGAKTITVADGKAFKPGDTILVTRNGNAAWITEIGMDRIQGRPGNESSTRQWQPFSLSFDRVVTAVDGDRITFDAPITCAIDARWGGEVVKYDNLRIQRVGIEYLSADCAFDASKKAKDGGKEYLADEEHAKRLVRFENVQHAWARNLSTRILEGVSTLVGGAKWVTIQDCRSIDPVSILTGGRRYPFDISGGQLCLYRNCYARDARHAFVVGSRVCGPNVFLDCKSESDHATSEPHHRWSVGGLYDNVDARIAIQDRQWMGSGHGWAGANYVTWNCKGSLVVQQPPTAQNFAIGFVGSKVKAAFERPSGWWESEGTPVTPRSLYEAQRTDRKARKGG
jgi:hypothetical protein